MPTLTGLTRPGIPSLAGMTAITVACGLLVGLGIWAWLGYGYGITAGIAGFLLAAGITCLVADAMRDTTPACTRTGCPCACHQEKKNMHSRTRP